MVFYLGYGCLHCAEQLQAIAPMVEDFDKAGIDLIAVSSDDLEGLGKSQENYDGEKIPFPLVANPSQDVFKAFRAYDDFEDLPLHGTFLIDGEGRVRWQDISYDPFVDTEFLLTESKRLLRLPRNLNERILPKSNPSRRTKWVHRRFRSRLVDCRRASLNRRQPNVC